jgi:hypothetical protein
LGAQALELVRQNAGAGDGPFGEAEDYNAFRLDTVRPSMLKY